MECQSLTQSARHDGEFNRVAGRTPWFWWQDCVSVFPDLFWCFKQLIVRSIAVEFTLFGGVGSADARAGLVRSAEVVRLQMFARGIGAKCAIAAVIGSMVPDCSVGSISHGFGMNAGSAETDFGAAPSYSISTAWCFFFIRELAANRSGTSPLSVKRP